MIYIFEDHPGSPLQKCFLQCYPEGHFKDNIFFVKGNINIPVKLNELIEQNKTNEDVVIYLDLVPDNPHTRDVYRQIDKQYRCKFTKLIVLPIPCMEYYYIKAFQRQEKFRLNEDAIKTVIERGWHKDQPLKRTVEERQKYWSFEKFCKLVMQRAIIICLHNWTKNTHNIEYLQVSCADCSRKPCLCTDRERPQFQINAKKKNFIHSFPCVPAGSNFYEPKRLMGWGDIIKIHRKLVAEYNLMCSRYNAKIASLMGIPESEKVPPQYRCKPVKNMY